MRYSDLATDVDETRVTTARCEATGGARWLVPYDDHDGISLLADREALRARYRDHDLGKLSMTERVLGGASVATDPTRTLTTLLQAGEIACWGTHQAGSECVAVLALEPFTRQERDENGVRSTVEAGVLRLTGPLIVAAWHSFTYGCDYGHGVIEEALEVELPPGNYGVTVHRPYAADEDTSPDEHARIPYLIELARLPDDVRATASSIPGGDGWL